MLIRLFTILFAITLLALFPKQLKAKIFKNAYISFEIPETWECGQEKTEWLCHKYNKTASGSISKKIEAIIILTAKQIGPSDTLNHYSDHLKQAKKLPFGNYSHKIHYIRNIKIHNNAWIDSLQFNSEAPNFYTRYMATAKPKLGLGILATFSTHRKYYSKYLEIFSKAINSLRVVQNKKLLNASVNSKIFRKSKETLGAPIGSILSNTIKTEDLETEKESPLFIKLLFIAIILSAIVGVVIIRKRKKSPFQL